MSEPAEASADKYQSVDADETISSPQPLQIDSNNIPLLQTQHDLPGEIPEADMIDNAHATAALPQASDILPAPADDATTLSQDDSIGPKDGEDSSQEDGEYDPSSYEVNPLAPTMNFQESSVAPQNTDQTSIQGGPPGPSGDADAFPTASRNSEPQNASDDSEKPKESSSIPSKVDLQKLLASLTPAPGTTPTIDPSEAVSDVPAPLPQLGEAPAEQVDSSTKVDLLQESVELSPEEEAAFEQFVLDEREYVSRGQWDRFPYGSRLFIGNLPSEKVGKRGVFKIFNKHGRLAQISIKQAYGFVQYYSAEDASRAIAKDQGYPIGGRGMHIEVSKPQKSRNQGSKNNARSPDRRERSPRRRSRGYNHNNNNYDDRRRGDERHRRSPQRYREEFYREPVGRFRSPSPPGGDMPLPRRTGMNVPEAQLIVLDDCDRGFIYYVETAFRDKSVRIDTLFLSPRLPVPEVVKQMIFEGVLAIVFLNRALQGQTKVSLQVFDRRGGDTNVRFDEYQNVDIGPAVELILRKRMNAPTSEAPNFQRVPQQGYGAPLQGNVAGISPQIANLISTLDPGTVQKVLGSLQQQQQHPAAPNPYAAQTYDAYNGGGNAAALHQLLGQGSSGQQQQQSVQNLMQQLSRFQGQGGMR